MLGHALLMTIALPALASEPPQTGPAQGPATDSEEGVPVRKSRRDLYDPEVEASVTAACEAGARHLARVRVYRTQEFFDWTGEVVGRTETELGFCHGLILTHEPMIAVSPSSCRIDQAGMANFRPRRKPKGVSDRKYQVILNDGTHLDASLDHEDVSINIHFLRLEGITTVPDELRSPLPLQNIRRLKPTERYGCPVFANILQNNSTTQLLGNLGAGKGDFPRPAIRAVNLPHLMVPAFAADSSLVGFANLPTPEEGIPPVRVDPRNTEAPPGKDPTEWNTGIRRPLLFPATELVPKVKMLIEEYEAPISFSPLSVTLRNQGAAVVVHKLHDGADGSLQVGDRLISIGGIEIQSVNGFFAGFETSLESEETPRLRLDRGGEELEIDVRLGG